MEGRTGNGVYTFVLKPGADYEHKLFKLKIGEMLHFKLSPEIVAEDVLLYSDYPTAPDKQYRRDEYQELSWVFRGEEPRWDPDRYVDLLIERAGTFKFYFCNRETPARSSALGQGFLVVEPALHRPLDSITCLTHISKLLGPLSEWKDRIRVAKEAGYNMVHLTPVQQLGGSNSAYSIKDQLKLDARYFSPSFESKMVTASYKDPTGAIHQLEVDSSLLECKHLIDDLKSDWDIDTISDVVWNHTSYDTPWLVDHPDAGYNLVNSPHLRPAYALDVALATFSQEISEGKWDNAGISPFVSSENDVRVIHSRLRDTVFPKARLWEYFCVDITAIVEKFRHSVYKKQGPTPEIPPEGKSLTIIQDAQYRRLGSYVDANLTMQLFNVEHPRVVCFEERIERCCLELASALESLNNEVKRQVEEQLGHAADNLMGYIRYQFYEGHGPKWGRITKEQPLFPRYFTVVGGGPDLSWADIESPKGQFVLAHNGWVMNADPLANFATPGSQVYFQRELVVWGDSVKLRYGAEPKDNPWLWEHMIRYTKISAWLFQGFRLDNCHNTPIAIAERLLDVARSVKSDLYVMAELFTGSEGTDNYFVNRLGIHSLVREAMFAPIPFELGRLVYQYGGAPVASFISPPVLRPSTAHAVFYDVTHDNDPGHILSRSVYDALPNSALVGIASCASASTRGYDEVVPHKIDVVTESRLYPRWSEMGLEVGIISAKAVMNILHQRLTEEGYTEIFVDQVSDDVVAVTRHCPATHESVILVAHTSFRHPPHGFFPTEEQPRTNCSSIPNLTVKGLVEEILFEARMCEKTSPEVFLKTKQGPINGMTSHAVYFREHIAVSESIMCAPQPQDGGSTEVRFTDLCPGSVVAFKVSLMPEAVQATAKLRAFLDLPCPAKGTAAAQREGRTLMGKLVHAIPKLTLSSLNYVLYRCDAEEQDDGKGGGVYNVPGYGNLVYCGIQGFASVLEGIRNNNDLGHPVCENLRAGNWMAGYTAERLKLRQDTHELGVLLSEVFAPLSVIPHYLMPCLFEAIITKILSLLLDEAHRKMGEFVFRGSSLVKQLAMGSVQFMGVARSAPLPPYNALNLKSTPSMAAGLPHFTTGAMRTWGRDTFIAYRGLLLVTQRFQEAKHTLLSFAATIRHGLIPNLLGGGLGARYNCRDAVWWWLQSIQDYCKMAPSGADILDSEVVRIFADDEDKGDLKDDGRKVTPLHELIQEVLQRHAVGISFRERGAGPELDYDMSPPGFNVTAGIDTSTGFPFGGSVQNCGTWMDKMGGSSWAGNKGVPATPRDGSAVEIVGLCKSTVRWLAKQYSRGVYPYSGVSLAAAAQPSGKTSSKKKNLSYVDWNKLLQQSFEAKFWIPESLEEGQQREGDEGTYIHRTGIYKDSYGASQRYADFQLRPNFSIAMVVAPELFDPAHAWAALENAEKILLGPLGIATLDPKDWAYDGFYNNQVDSGVFKTAKGFNYHQGPEWLWVAGYFMRAKLMLAQHYSEGQYLNQTITRIHKFLANHIKMLNESPWRSLPELTNQNGTECHDSCPAQAWSLACFLDLLFDISQIKVKK